MRVSSSRGHLFARALLVMAHHIRASCSGMRCSKIMFTHPHAITPLSSLRWFEHSLRFAVSSSSSSSCQQDVFARRKQTDSCPTLHCISLSSWWIAVLIAGPTRRRRCCRRAALRCINRSIFAAPRYLCALGLSVTHLFTAATRAHPCAAAGFTAFRFNLHCRTHHRSSSSHCTTRMVFARCCGKDKHRHFTLARFTWNHRRHLARRRSVARASTVVIVRHLLIAYLPGHSRILNNFLFRLALFVAHVRIAYSVRGAYSDRAFLPRPIMRSLHMFFFFFFTASTRVRFR